MKQLALCLLLAGLAHAVPAQDLAPRDPTQWPAALRSAVAAAAAASAAPGEAAIARRVEQILIIQGKPFVVSQGRRLGVGAMLGEARILRISESAVWLVEAGVTRRETLHAGVEKLPEGAAGSKAPARKTTTNKATGARPESQEKS